MECNGCGTDSAQKKYEKDGYNFLQCSRYCGLLFVDSGNKTQAQKVYNKEYTERRTLWTEDARDNLVEDFRRRSAQRLINEIKKYAINRSASPLKLLDVGCGEGYFLEVAKANGYEVYGTEVSEHSARLTAARIGKPVFLGTLGAAGFPDNYFDVVCLIDVIEHLEAPFQQMQEIKRLLKKDGILCIQTPNLKSFYSKLMGSKWFQIKPREHLFYFSDRSLPILLKRLNFKVKEMKATGIYITPRYLVNILSQTNSFLSILGGGIFKVLFMYDTVLYLPSGHLLCISQNDG